MTYNLTQEAKQNKTKQNKNFKKFPHTSINFKILEETSLTPNLKSTLSSMYKCKQKEIEKKKIYPLFAILKSENACQFGHPSRFLPLCLFKSCQNKETYGTPHRQHTSLMKYMNLKENTTSKLFKLNGKKKRKEKKIKHTLRLTHKKITN